MTIVFCSLFQAANMIIPFLNNVPEHTEILAENADCERTCQEDSDSYEWYGLFSQKTLPLSFSYLKNQNLTHDYVASNSFLTKPETPPPNYF